MSTISASTTTTTAYKVTADTTGTLVLQTGATPTTAVTVDTSQNVGIANTTPSSFDPTGRNLVVGSGSGNQGMTIYAGTTGYASVNFADGTVGSAAYAGQVSYDHTNNALLFATNTGVERMRIDSSGNLLFNSGYGSVATAYGCRAWVSFAGATGTRAGSGNVSSVTRNSTGNYTVNFASALVDANYSAVCTTRNGSIAGLSQGTLATSSFTFLTTNVAGSSTDSTDNGVAVFR